VSGPGSSDEAVAGATNERRRVDSLTLEECRAGAMKFTYGSGHKITGEGAHEFIRLVEESAKKYEVNARALSVRALLHLPRVADRQGSILIGEAEEEVQRCSAVLRDAQAKVAALIPAGGALLDEHRFSTVVEAEATLIFDNLHYLCNARSDSRTFALLDPVGRPVSLCSASPLEWDRVGRQISIQFGIPQDRIWDLSRVYSFDVAPPNAISHFLKLVRKHLRKSNPEVELLMTAVDPNVGFTGVSYRSDNWQPWMTVRHRPYFYFDQDYISLRRIRQEFKTADLDRVRVAYGERFERSRAKLLDSVIFCCRLKGVTERVPEEQLRRLRR
jgi:hypothetical protein